MTDPKHTEPGVVVTAVHEGWAESAAQHLCHEADWPAATRLLADAFARFETEVRTAAEAPSRQEMDRLRAEVSRYRAACEQGQRWFAEYAEHHQQQAHTQRIASPQRLSYQAKADRNRHRAEFFRAALSPTAGEGDHG